VPTKKRPEFFGIPRILLTVPKKRSHIPNLRSDRAADFDALPGRVPASEFAVAIASRVALSESHFDIVMVAVLGPLLALVAIVAFGSLL